MLQRARTRQESAETARGGSRSTIPPPARYAAGVAFLAAAYYVSARVGLELAYLDGAVAALWPPVGVALAAVFFFGFRLLPGIVVGDLLPGVADYSQPLGTVLGQTVGNTVAVVVATLLLRRLIGHRGAALERMVDVLAFVAAAAVAAAVSACFGPPALWLGGVIEGDELTRVFRTWFLSDLSGALVVTPILLTWAARRARGFGRREALEALVLLALLVALAEIPSQREVPYIVFPLLIWAALRFGPRGAATAIFLVSSIAVWNTAQTAGPFVRESITHSLLSTQLFIATAALTSFVLAAVTAERRRASDELRANQERVRALAEEQAALRRVATLVASDAPPSAVFARVTEEAARLLAASSASVVRFEDGAATVVGGWSEPGTPQFPVGSTVALNGDTVVARVFRTGKTQRLDSYRHARGELAKTLREFGYRSPVAAPVKVGGKLWGALAVATSRSEPLPEDAESRLCDFAELVAQALANADAYEKLASSRARLVEAGDSERRRLERNLHDGAQQRLVALALQLRLVEAKLDSDPAAARELLSEAHGRLEQALEELRELARGIHPAILTERGLAPALEALVARAPVPVEVAEVPEERLPEPVEAAAYYVVSEAVTNAAKYARASSVTVSISRSDGRALVQIADDGVGGADPARGSGLRGLTDRVEALEGRLEVKSPEDAGTQILAEIPC